MISGNQVRESSGVGLAIRGGSPRVTGNRVEDGVTGIALGAGAKPVLADNFACGNEVDITRLNEPVAAVEGITVCDVPGSPAP